MMSWHLLAKVEQQTLKDEDRAGAAQDGERLAGQQAEHRTWQRRANKTLQHSL